MTGREMISASLRLIGAIAPGESLAAQEATDGLASLNRMLGSWSNEGLLIYTPTRDELTLTPGTATYTMGPGGTFNTARPISIETALIRDESVTPAVESPVNILSLAEWAAIITKDIGGPTPTAIYSDGANPQTVITLYPKPTAAKKLILYSQKPLAQITTLDTAVSLPPGYDDAIIYNLAVRLAPEYGAQVRQDVMITANDAKASIKRINQRPTTLTVESSLLLGRGGTFNIYTGGA